MPSTSQPYVAAACLIPASGEYVYDTVAFSGGMGTAPPQPVNLWRAPGGTRTDMMFALDDLQESLPNCGFVALVVQWMGNSLDASQCRVYPSSTYIGGLLEPLAGGSESWRVSDLGLATPGLIPISRPDGVHAAYGGTPSDASVVRAIREIRRRGLKVALYLQMNMDLPGQPWRGLCTYAPDVDAAAVAAVSSFLGAATPSMFTPDASNLTVHYSGPLLDFSYRRFVLHYAWLCTVAGGVNLLTVGSELRGLESIRGPAWTPAGGLGASGAAQWDYPFVAALTALLDDCRSIFDSAGCARNVAARENLLCYSPDWSQWTGAQHAGVSGIFPHLDQLYACANLDVAMIDNYMPLSDWTTGGGGLDAENWRAPPRTVWPDPAPQTLGFGLDGPPQLRNLDYLKANIEHGERFDYWYADASSASAADPSGAALTVTCPAGDRLAQQRSPYYAGQELFALKNIRWWWNNPHCAVYDAGDGQGVAPHGAATAWTPQSKSVGFMEYGFPSIDRCTNEENVFFDPQSVSGSAPFWCVWEEAEGAGLRPRADATLQFLAHRAVREYWTSDGNNAASAAGLPMIATDLLFAWAWDARPFPTFPTRLDVWSDGVDWRVGHWLCGKGPALPPSPPDAVPQLAAEAAFPQLRGIGPSTVWRPLFGGSVALHANGREVRRVRAATPLWRVEFDVDLTTLATTGDLELLVGFFEQMQGAATPFLLPAPPELGVGLQLPCRFADDILDVEEFLARLFRTKSLELRTIRP